MRISKINSFILPKAVNNKTIKKHDNIQNNFNTQNSSNVIKNHTLSHKDNEKFLTSNSFFNQVSFGRNQQMNNYRQQVVDKLASIEEFPLNSEQNRLYFQQRVTDIQTQESADAKIALIEKYTNDKKWQNNKFIQENIGYFFYMVEKEGFVDFIDKVLETPELAENKKMQRNILDMAHSYKDRNDDVFFYKNAVLDKFLSAPKLKNNKKITEKIVREIKLVNTQEHSQAKIEIMDKYLKNKTWKASKDKNLEQLFIDLLGVQQPDDNGVRASVIDIVIKNPELYDTDEKRSKVYSLLALANTQEKATVAKKLLSVPDFLQENLDGMFPSFLSHVDSQEYAESVISLFDKITSEPKLRDNESIQKNLNGILYLWYNDKKEVAESRLSVMEKYLSDKELQKTEGINKRLGQIIEEANQTWKADIANCFLSDSKLYKDKWIQNRMVDTYRTSVGRDQDQPTVFEVGTKLIQNQKKYNQENLEKLLSCLKK